MALYTVCTVICGISKNIGTFFAFRMLQSIFASTGQALGSGTASDLFEPQDRGKATSFYILGYVQEHLLFFYVLNLRIKYLRKSN
jgi:MFS family permease